MVDNKDKSVSSEERVALISEEGMRNLNKNHPLRCVDDRAILEGIDYDSLPDFVVKPEESAGAQMLGGSYSIFDIALELLPEDIDPEFDVLYDLTEKSHKDAGYVMGIHMDNQHDELDENAVIELLEKAKVENETDIPGCGYNGLVHSSENPLELSERSVNFHNKYPNRAALFIQKGVKTAILGGHHAPKENALAIINTKMEQTLDTRKAIDLGQPAYNHDKPAFEEILNSLSDNANKIDPRWGENIREKGNDLYMKWYGIVANKLAGMDPKIR